MSAPSPEDRLGAWLATERQDGESIEAATSRFRTTELQDTLAAIRRESGKRVQPIVDLVDDGLSDAKWARKNPTRQYRVRPWRRIDGVPATYHAPCFTVFDIRSKRGTWGIPVDALHHVGFPASAQDSDLYGQLVLEVFRASLGFRHKKPGFTG
ncbi:MAG: hypothetical protein EON59_03415 [Alphaproteobacteria bacterium]|nr:MAG: hypothetical protein EON59_03415 [Alphaproteobacteria bacterium]